MYYYNSSRPATPPVTKNLIIINIAVFVLGMLDKSNVLVRQFALFNPETPFFHIWQPITHMFLHGGFWHIFFNMYSLYLFGGMVERMIGSKKYLAYYLICGLGGALLHMGVQSLGFAFGLTSVAQMCVPTVGASGAIYGLIIAYAMMFPEQRLTLIFPPVTMSARTMVLVFVGIELFTGLSSMSSLSLFGGVAHFAHLGGMLLGWLVVLFWRKRGVLFEQDSWF